MKKIVANLHNTKTNRFHPIIFSERYFPGNPDTNLIRAKSDGHHTKGFDTREEALAECSVVVNKLKETQLGTPQLCVEKDFAWDGEPNTAAMVVIFTEKDGAIVPMGN